MTSYKVISLPGDTSIAENLTYSQAQAILTAQGAIFPHISYLIEKMPELSTRDLKTKLALEALANFHVYASDMRYGPGRLDTHVDKIAAYAGLHWNKNFQVWYTHETDAQHELFKLHWQLSNFVQREIELGYGQNVWDIGKASSVWLDERGFNSVMIFKHWRIKNFGAYE